MGQGSGDGLARRGGVLDLTGEPAGDGGVIGGGAGEGAGGQTLAQGQIGGPLRFQRLKDQGDAFAIHGDRHMAVFLEPERIMAGPPMSIFSMAASKPPPDSTVFSKG